MIDLYPFALGGYRFNENKCHKGGNRKEKGCYVKVHFRSVCLPVFQQIISLK
jgi:hypothetical protein